MALSRALYGAAFDPGAWSVAAAALKEAIGAMAATLVVGTGNGAYLTVYSDCDPHYSDLYWRDLAPRDFMLAGPGADGMDCDVYTNQMVLDDRQFQRSVLFNDWLQPQGRHSILLMKLRGGDGPDAIFVFNRGGKQPPFGADDIQFANALLPTVQHVILQARHMMGLRLSTLLVDSHKLTVPHLVLNRRLGVLHMNTAAEALLRRPESALAVLKQTLVARNHAAHRELSTRVAYAGSRLLGSTEASGMIVRAADSAQDMMLVIAPLPWPAQTGLSVEDAVSVTMSMLRSASPPSVHSRLRDLFQLSQREADLACALLDGLSLQEAANRRAVAITTLRSQLASLFVKTGTSRQGQLVALLARATADCVS